MHQVSFYPNLNQSSQQNELLIKEEDNFSLNKSMILKSPYDRKTYQSHDSKPSIKNTMSRKQVLRPQAALPVNPESFSKTFSQIFHDQKPQRFKSSNKSIKVGKLKHNLNASSTRRFFKPIEEPEASTQNSQQSIEPNKQIFSS